jgi:hypothetical protein
MRPVKAAPVVLQIRRLDKLETTQNSDSAG